MYPSSDRTGKLHYNYANRNAGSKKPEPPTTTSASTREAVYSSKSERTDNKALRNLSTTGSNIPPLNKRSVKSAITKNNIKLHFNYSHKPQKSISSKSPSRTASPAFQKQMSTIKEEESHDRDPELTASQNYESDTLHQQSKRETRKPPELLATTPSVTSSRIPSKTAGTAYDYKSRISSVPKYYVTSTPQEKSIEEPKIYREAWTQERSSHGGQLHRNELDKGSSSFDARSTTLPASQLHYVYSNRLVDSSLNRKVMEPLPTWNQIGENLNVDTTSARLYVAAARRVEFSPAPPVYYSASSSANTTRESASEETQKPADTGESQKKTSLEKVPIISSDRSSYSSVSDTAYIPSIKGYKNFLYRPVELPMSMESKQSPLMVTSASPLRTPTEHFTIPVMGIASSKPAAIDRTFVEVSTPNIQSGQKPMLTSNKELVETPVRTTSLPINSYAYPAHYRSDAEKPSYYPHAASKDPLPLSVHYSSVTYTRPLYFTYTERQQRLQDDQEKEALNQKLQEDAEYKDKIENESQETTQTESAQKGVLEEFHKDAEKAPIELQQPVLVAQKQEQQAESVQRVEIKQKESKEEESSEKLIIFDNDEEEVKAFKKHLTQQKMQLLNEQQGGSKNEMGARVGRQSNKTKTPTSDYANDVEEITAAPILSRGSRSFDDSQSKDDDFDNKMPEHPGSVHDASPILEAHESSTSLPDLVKDPDNVPIVLLKDTESLSTDSAKDETQGVQQEAEQQNVSEVEEPTKPEAPTSDYSNDMEEITAAPILSGGSHSFDDSQSKDDDFDNKVPEHIGSVHDASPILEAHESSTSLPGLVKDPDNVPSVLLKDTESLSTDSAKDETQGVQQEAEQQNVSEVEKPTFISLEEPVKGDIFPRDEIGHDQPSEKSIKVEDPGEDGVRPDADANPDLTNLQETGDVKTADSLDLEEAKQSLTDRKLKPTDEKVFAGSHHASDDEQKHTLG